MNIEKEITLAEIQALVKAPKGQFNSFGKYKFRSAEDIVEAVKPVINPIGFYLTITDELVHIGDRFYIKAITKLSNGKLTYSTEALAREESDKKGMDASQITGAASSYARKYALNGLFAIDDTRDADATNDHGKEDKKKDTPKSTAPKKVEPVKTPETSTKAPTPKKDLVIGTENWTYTVGQLKKATTPEAKEAVWTKIKLVFNITDELKTKLDNESK
jgi:hypothetical protein